MKLTIPRDIWMRGLGPGPSRLLDTSGDKRQQCCVGIWASSMGIPDEAIDNVPALDNAIRGAAAGSEAAKALQQFMLAQCKATFGKPLMHSLEYEAYQVNDSQSMGDMQREAIITSVFAQIGVEVTFVDSADGHSGDPAGDGKDKKGDLK